MGIQVQWALCTVSFYSLFPSGPDSGALQEGGVTAWGRVRALGCMAGCSPWKLLVLWVRSCAPQSLAPQDLALEAAGQTLPPYEAAQPQPFQPASAGSNR